MVLDYIANSVRRFHVFVANRVQEIRDKSAASQWKYVDMKSNPADEASRGIRPNELTESKWILGPDFLWKPEAEWDATLRQPVGDVDLPEDDPDVKKVGSLATAVTPSWPTLVDRLECFSDWHRVKSAIAFCRLYGRMLRSITQKRDIDKTTKLRRREGVQPISIQELNDAEVVILKAVQQEFDLDTSPSSPFAKLDPYTDSNGVISVGGRLNLSDVLGQVIHPAILRITSHVTDLIIKHFHQKVQHQGRGMTTNKIRASGYYWIVGAISAHEEPQGVIFLHGIWRHIKNLELKGKFLEYLRQLS